MRAWYAAMAFAFLVHTAAEAAGPQPSIKGELMILAFCVVAAVVTVVLFLAVMEKR